MSKIIICNHKMFLTYDEALNLENRLLEINYDNLIICPSFLNLNLFSNFKLGVQNCHYEDRGAFTGQVSAYNLSLRNVKYCIVGHSEVRNYDSDEVINLKIKNILKNSMTPILCIGENKYEHEMMKTYEVLKKQLKLGLKDVKLDKYQCIYIAYEPIYLIGGKKALSKSTIIDTVKLIKKILNELGIDNFKILYGGAVNKNNIDKLLDEEIDGFLLGKSSTNIDELKYIINCVK